MWSWKNYIKKNWYSKGLYGQLKAILLDKKWERESRIKYYKKRQEIMMKVNLFFDANQLVHHNCSKLIDTLRRSNASRWKQQLDRNKNRHLRNEAWEEKKQRVGCIQCDQIGRSLKMDDTFSYKSCRHIWWHFEKISL